MCKHEPDYTDANVSRLAAAPRAARFARFLGAVLDWMETGIYFEPCKMTRVELSRTYVYIYVYPLHVSLEARRFSGRWNIHESYFSQ